MTIIETTGDLLQAPQGNYLAHCISGDFTLGAGVAKIIDEEYNMKYKLKKRFSFDDGLKYGYVGQALLVDNVFNLVDKSRYYKKVDISDLESALVDMRDQCEENDITRLAIPRIGTGCDKLDWDEVFEMISDIFEDTDIIITVYSL